MTYTTIKYSVERNVGHVVLNRPDVLNSVNRSMGLELKEILDRCATSAEVRAVLLSGEGRAFCGGQDLAEVMSGTPDLEEIVSSVYNPIVKALKQLEKPTVCKVQGAAAGAGANLALACDIVIAADDASFIQAFAKVGLTADSGGTFILPRLVGVARATGLMMTGDRVSGKDAVTMGMIYKSVPASELDNAASELATRLAVGPGMAFALTKRALRESLQNELSAQLRLEAQLQGVAGRSEDFREGLSAFSAKRSPLFKGC